MSALHNDITLRPQWIPRSENQRADTFSKFHNKEDRKINLMIFDQLNLLWGLRTVDRSSSHYNNQIQRFNSRFASPGCEAVDALPQNWSIKYNWVCPPVSMIIPVIHHFMKCKAKGTLIIPEWRLAHFWPVIKQHSPKFPDFVIDFRYLCRIENMIIPGQGQLEIYRPHKSVFQGCPSFNMLL